LIFENKKFYGEDTEYAVLCPKKEKKKGRIPVLVISGWGAHSLEQYKKPLIALSEARITIGVNTISGVSHEMMILTEEHRSLWDHFSYIHIRKAIALLDVLKKNKIKIIDAVAYSEGAIIIAIAASMEPSKFRNIVFVNPAGITDPRSSLSFFSCYLRELFLGIKEAFLQRAFWKKLDRVCEGPVRRFLLSPLRSLSEMANIAKTDIRQTLLFLKGKKIRFSLLLAKNDQLFPIKEARISVSEHLFVEIKENEGRHSNFIFGETETLLEMLSFLEKERR